MSQLNTDNTSCSGTLRVSSDNFSNCVQMASSPSSSNSDKTFTLDPSDNLTGGTTYLTRVTTGVKDVAGNALSSQYDNSTGFTTTSSSTQMGGSIQGTELDLTTAVTTFAGSGNQGVTDGAAASAEFRSAKGITTDGTNLYVADTANHLIRKIVISTGVVSTIAGSAGSSGKTDGTGTAAKFKDPTRLVPVGNNLYVADTGNHRIRKVVIDNGTVTTFAGSSSGNDDHPTGTLAEFDEPIGITTDGTNLYVADYKNHRIRKIVIENGTVTTLAGSSSGVSNGMGTAASFRNPRGITTDGTNLYVTEKESHTIRKIVIDNASVTTLAGRAGSWGSTDGQPENARFNKPNGITTDGTNLYVTGYVNNRIRKIVISTGVVSTLAGSSAGYTDHETGLSAQFDFPWGITTDGKSLYVIEMNNHRIRKID